MTLKQALQSIFQFEVPSDVLEKSLIDAGLVPENTYSSANHAGPIDLCAVGLCDILLTTPNVSENGLSISLDTGKLRELKRVLQVKQGLSLDGPEVLCDPVW